MGKRFGLPCELEPRQRSRSPRIQGGPVPGRLLDRVMKTEQVDYTATRWLIRFRVWQRTPLVPAPS